MINKKDLPKKIPVFPLSNFIIFPKTTVPLNIFEPRYIDMVNDSMKQEKFIGMIQPKTQKSLMGNNNTLYQIGCLGKITSFIETDDKRFLIELKGIVRFEIEKEVVSNKKYRECEVSYESFYEDLNKYHQLSECLVKNFFFLLHEQYNFLKAEILLDTRHLDL